VAKLKSRSVFFIVAMFAGQDPGRMETPQIPNYALYYNFEDDFTVA
jgi:hypothetical protein